MATRYAVASGNWSNAASVWSDTDGGSAGSFVPVDGDAAVISASVNVLMDVDQSAWTGMLTVTVRGGATPGVLYFKDATDGYLKLRTGYNLAGTSDTNNGRLLANSDGSWGTTTALQYSNSAIIDLNGTAKVDAANLDIKLYCTQPSTTRLRLYGTKKTVTSVDTANDTVTIAGHGYAVGKVLSITSSGDVPTGLYADRTYYVRTVTTDTFKLAEYNNDTCIVDLAGAGSGTIVVFDAPASGSATVNTLDDVLSDNWAEGDACVLVDDGAPSTYDQQRVTVDTINAGTVVLSATVDSAQYPNCHLYLVQRNVAIRSSAVISGQPIVDGGTGGVFQCEIRNTAGSGTAFYGYGIYAGTSHTVSGTISGCSYGIRTGTSHTVSGTISGCNYGIYAGTSHTVSGTISGCSYGTYTGTSYTVSGTISGCSRGIYIGTSHTISGAISGCFYGIYIGTSHTISGAISGCFYGTYTGTSHTVSGTISGCSRGISAGTSYTVSGTISWCTYGIYTGTSHTVSGTISGCTYGIYTGTGKMQGAVLENNSTADCYRTLQIIAYATELGSTTQTSGITQAVIPYMGQNLIYVHNFDTASGGTVNKGSIAIWNQGGTMESAAYVEGTHGDLQASGWALPDPDWIHTATFDTAALPNGAITCPLWIEFPIQSIDGETIEFECNVKLSTTSDWTALPRVQIIDAGKGWMQSGEVLSEDIAVASSGWQNLSVTRVCTAEQQLRLRVYGTRTVRNGSFDWCWRQVVGSGSSTVFIMPQRPNSLLRR